MALNVKKLTDRNIVGAYNNVLENRDEFTSPDIVLKQLRDEMNRRCFVSFTAWQDSGEADPAPFFIGRKWSIDIVHWWTKKRAPAGMVSMTERVARETADRLNKKSKCNIIYREAVRNETTKTVSYRGVNNGNN